MLLWMLLLPCEYPRIPKFHINLQVSSRWKTTPCRYRKLLTQRLTLWHFGSAFPQLFPQLHCIRIWKPLMVFAAYINIELQGETHCRQIIIYIWARNIPPLLFFEGEWCVDAKYRNSIFVLFLFLDQANHSGTLKSFFRLCYIINI